jgi:hypothetical protein
LSRDRNIDGGVQVWIHSCEVGYFKVYFYDRGQEFLIDTIYVNGGVVLSDSGCDQKLPVRVHGLESILFKMYSPPAPYAKIVLRNFKGDVVLGKYKVFIDRINPTAHKVIIENTWPGDR